jgi:hypothetical protein
MIAAFQISSFQNGRSDYEPGAVGNGRAVGARRINREGVVGKQSISRRGTEDAPRGDYVPVLEDSTAERFAVVILPFQRKVVARIAGVGVDTVKAWRKGRQVPQSEHLFRMARNIPAVKRWTLRQLGVTEQPEFMSPQVLTAMMAAVNQVAHQAGPDGEAIRALLRGEQ